jgi:hypothetical protein
MGGNLMQNKITAVEWLAVQLEKYYGNQKITDTEAFITAKAMEELQIIDAHDSGYIDGQGQKSISAEQYYTETYGE